MVRELVKKLLGLVKYYQPEGYSPLHFVVDKNFGISNPANRLEMFQNIFNEEEDKNPKDFLGNTPLHIAAKDPRKLNICKLILENTQDKNPPNENYDKNTPLHIAALSGNIEYFELFLNYSSDIMPKNCNENTPFHLAAENNYLELCEFFISKIKGDS